MTTYSPSEASAPYEDAAGEDGFLRYKYRGTDSGQADNRTIREAMDERPPMIWFYGIGPGTYPATFPVYAVAEEADRHQFVVSADVPVDLAETTGGSAIEREYRRVHAYQRVHQPVFRARVMRAYDQRCAMCSLRHVSLLDAAHILRDGHAQGIAAVSNEMALCKIHQEMAGMHLMTPRSRAEQPKPDAVEERYAEFLAASP